MADADMRRTVLSAAEKHIIIMTIILCQSLNLTDSRLDLEEQGAAAAESFNPVFPLLCWDEHLQYYISFRVSVKTT